MLDRLDNTRRKLIGALLLAGGMAPGLLAIVRDAQAGSKVPTVPGVQDFSGVFRINGTAAGIGQIVKPGDIATTGPGASAIIVIGVHAYLLDENSEIEFYPEYFSEDDDGTISGTLKVISGAMLAVFGKTDNTSITTPFVILGIRGTGVYVNTNTERTYACVCYGRAVLSSVETGQLLETVTTTHHESPRYIYPPGAPIAIEKAPVIDHSDAELRLLESLVHRKPPFDKAGSSDSDRY